MGKQGDQTPVIATAVDGGEAELAWALAREGIDLPPEWIAGTAAEYHDLRAKIARLRE
ncbi:hypothetical protein ACFQX4_20625 [Roseomonas sp. GCM10028921]